MGPCFHVRTGRVPHVFLGSESPDRSFVEAALCASLLFPNSELTTGAKSRKLQKINVCCNRDQENETYFRVQMPEKFSFNNRKLARGS